MVPKASAHAVYDLKHHFGWMPKYQMQLLAGEVAGAMREMLPKTADAYEMTLDTLEAAEDHVHIFL